jgi:hypothetical protein
MLANLCNTLLELRDIRDELTKLSLLEAAGSTSRELSLPKFFRAILDRKSYQRDSWTPLGLEPLAFWREYSA